ncbi:MAG: phosphoserine transaminase [Acidimicrobiaceae bacterium]|nr:phosphoserine transaminase [Acidimicrobiaceae bacterium]MBO0748531.1 phosphoserine transaminase [Acidimicrobiaceae bacterium]
MRWETRAIACHAGTVAGKTSTDIRIPPALLPADGRFGAGPSKIRPEALAALSRASELGTSHRADPVRNLVGRLRSGLTELFGLPAGWEVALGNGGSVLFWDAATFGVIERRSQHLSFGEFSTRFAATVAAAPHLETPEVIEAPPGALPSAKGAPGLDTYALTQNETSTGVMAPLVRPRGSDRDALVLVDATSAAGGIPFEPSEVDAYYFAPQKCFASDGGLWVALLSPAALSRIERIRASARWIPASLNLGDALEQSRRNQTVNTPAVATLFLFVHQLEWLLAGGGMHFAAARCRASSGHLYAWAERAPFAQPFVARPEERSTVVGTVDFDPAVDAAAVCAALRANGIVDTEPYRKLGRNQMRVGMYPAVDPADVEALTACVDYVVEALG